MAESKRERYQKLRAQLHSERSSFLSHWRDLGDHILPRRPRFSVTDVNRGDRRNQSIINSTATQAARTLRSGMMGGITSPARPWFRLSTPDPDLAEFSKVKEWLHIVGQRMTTVFLRSNLYKNLPTTYGDLGVFGTAALAIEEDLDSVINTYSFPVGSYAVGNSDRLKVEVFTRDFRMTVRQIVRKFGQVDEKTGRADWSRFSQFVRDQFERGNYETWVDVVHLVQPNEAFDRTQLDSKFKRFSSVYYEAGRSSQDAYDLKNHNGFLSDKGYDQFPILVPRWEVTGEDVYGTTCPGMEALGDIRQLQLGERRLAEAIDKMVRPPMKASATLRGQKASIIPGDITYLDEQSAGAKFEPIYQVNPRVLELAQKNQQIETRIQRAFYEDLFLMLAHSDRREITATEIDARKEEKLLALGPVLEQLNQDLLDPLIENTFAFMLKQSDFERGTGPVPPPPEELAGVDLRVEYISVMAQAQKLIGIGTQERFTSYASNIIAMNPSSAAKIDFDQMIDQYGEITGVAPNLVRPDEQVEAIRAEEARAQQAQMMAQQMREVSQSAKTLSQADTSSENALTALLQQGQAGSLVGGG